MQEKKLNSEVVRSVYESIKELYLNYCEELEETKKKLDHISLEIKETEEYISYLSEHQNSDTFVFSPRGVISKNSVASQDASFDTGKVIDFSDTGKKKEELLKLERNRKSCQDRIIKLNSTITILSDNKDILKEVISMQSSFEEEQKILEEKQATARKEYEEKKNVFSKDIQNGPLDKLNFISHNLDMIDSYILQDPMRAKLSLINIKENVSSVSDTLEQLVRVPEGDN